jgi:hypothetical protein
MVTDDEDKDDEDTNEGEDINHQDDYYKRENDSFATTSDIVICDGDNDRDDDDI